MKTSRNRLSYEDELKSYLCANAKIKLIKNATESELIMIFNKAICPEIPTDGEECKYPRFLIEDIAAYYNRYYRSQYIGGKRFEIEYLTHYPEYTPSEWYDLLPSTSDEPAVSLDGDLDIFEIHYGDSKEKINAISKMDMRSVKRHFERVISDYREYEELKKTLNVNTPFFEKFKINTKMFFLYHNEKQYQAAQKMLPIIEKELDKRAAFYEKKKHREEKLNEYMYIHHGKNCLTIDTKDGFVAFWEDEADFDIYEAEKQAKNIVANLVKKTTQKKKRDNGNINSGEHNVDYSIKWFVADNKDYVFSIKKDCISKHSDSCILIYNPEYINEPQEIDHIVIGTSTIVLIETKDWKGNIKISQDGRWIARKKVVENPTPQLQRHEQLIKSIFPDMEVISLLCFSNSSIAIDGKDNYKDYKIIYIDQLYDVLSEIFAGDKKNKKKAKNNVSIIEKHKLRKAQSGK